MERMEEYQRMREEEADRPVPAELACLETRVRARAERPRRRRGLVLAAVHARVRSWDRHGLGHGRFLPR